MDTPTKPASNTKCKPCLFILVGFVLCILGGLGWVMRVVEKVFSGHGLEIYRTFWLVEFNYIGAFVSIVGIACAVLVLAVLQLRQWWLWRDFEKKYKRE